MATIKNLVIRLTTETKGVDGGVTKTTQELRYLAREADNTERSLKSLGENAKPLGDRFDWLGAAAARVTSSIAGFVGSLASAGVKLATGAALLASLSASMAAAGGAAIELAAALAPAIGLLAGLPGLAATGAAALTVWKLAVGGLGEAMGAAMSGNAEALAAAMEKLSDGGKAFVTEFQQAIPLLKTFKSAAQDAFTGELTGSLAPFIERLQVLKPAIAGLAAEFGAVVREVLVFGRAEQSLGQFNVILDNTRTLVAGFRAAMQPLLTGFLDLAEVGSNWLGGFSGQLTKVVSQFGQWMSEISSNGQALAWLNDAVVVLKQLGAIVKDVWQIFSGLFEAAEKAGAPALGVLGQLVDKFNDWVNSAAGQDTLVTIFRELHRIGDALSPVIEALGRALATVAPAVADIAVAFSVVLADAINAVAPALAALGPGIVAVINGLGAAVLALAPALVPVGEAIGALLAAAAPLLPILGQVAALIANSLASGVQSVLPSLQLLVSSIGQALIALSPVVPLVVSLAAALINSLVPALAPLLPQIAELVTRLVQGLVPALMPLIPIVGQIVAVLGQTFVQILGVLVDVILRLVPPLAETARILAEAFLDALQRIQPYLPQLLDALLSWLPALIDLLPVFARLAVALLPQFLDALEKILPLLPDIIRSGIELTQAWMPLIPILSDLLIKLIPYVPTFLQLAAAIAQHLLPALTNFLQTVSNVVNRVVGFFQWLYDILIGHSIIPDLVNGIVRWIGSLPGSIMQALGNMGNLLVSAGRDLVVGFWNGIVSLWNWLVSNVQNLFNSIADWAKSVLGIASPSKVFAEIGRNLTLGMALGITKSAGLVESAVAGLATTATVAVGATMLTPALAGGVAPAGGGATGNTYQITVQVPPSANAADVGAEVVKAIQEFERRSGASWREGT